MKVHVKADGHNINIPIPTALIFSKPSVWLYLKLAKKFSSQASEFTPGNIEITVDRVLDRIPEEAVYALCAELMRVKRKHGTWTLVEVKAATGEEVTITL